MCETHYFLKRMVENRNAPNPFKFNFSAFLAAFDSIWDFMNRELRALKLEGGGRWWCNVYLGTSNPDPVGNYDVYAVIVDSASATNFQNYLDNSNQQHSWPGVSSQPGVISYDHIALTRAR